MPAIAVIMPVYNRADRVRRTIDSVLAQDFTDFELIVVDDGSQDGTADVVEAIPDPRVRCLRQPRNRGPSAARNRGLRETASPIICFIDSDDEFLPHKLGFIARYFDENPEIDVLVDSFRADSPSDLDMPPKECINPELEGSDEVARAVFSGRLHNPTPAQSARRDALVAAGLFDETLRLREDTDLILRLARSARCAATSEILWTKHWLADSLFRNNKDFVTGTTEICARHPSYLTQPEFRVHLARALVRHFLRLAKKGRIDAAGRDGRRCAKFFGWPRFAGLFGAGLVEMLRRSVARSRG